MKHVALLVALAAPLLAGCADQPPADARIIDVEIGRYQFEPGTSFAINAAMGETIVLRLTSTDVTHGFSILEYGVNVEVPPGQVVEVTLRIDKPGEFTIFCTVFCGSGHPQHKGALHVA